MTQPEQIATNGKRQLNRLDGKQVFRLTQYVQEKYVASGLTDREFALQAATDLDFAVTDGNVRGARETLDIISNHTAKLQQTPQLMVKRVEALEKDVLTLKAFINRVWEVAYPGTSTPFPNLGG